MEILVFDTGPLSHFAKENWLGVLKAVVGARRAVIPDVVVGELEEGSVRDSRLNAVLGATWLERIPLESDEEIRAFAHFASLLVRGKHNRGEAAVLALASTIGGVAVIDDAAARKAAEDHGVPKRPTLALLCEAVRAGLLSIGLVSALADDLIASDYHLPFRTGDFERWAIENGLV